MAAREQVHRRRSLWRRRRRRPVLFFIAWRCRCLTQVLRRWRRWRRRLSHLLLDRWTSGPLFRLHDLRRYPARAQWLRQWRLPPRWDSCRHQARCHHGSNVVHAAFEPKWLRNSIYWARPGRAPKLLKIRPEVCDSEPDLGLKLGQTKPKISDTVPTNRHTTIPNDSGPIAARFTMIRSC